MGWGYYRLRDGREAGYMVEADCDYEGCTERIDRGLGYLCGTMPESTNEDGCGFYFCEAHHSRHDCEYDYCEACERRRYLGGFNLCSDCADEARLQNPVQTPPQSEERAEASTEGQQ